MQQFRAMLTFLLRKWRVEATLDTPFISYGKNGRFKAKVQRNFNSRDDDRSAALRESWITKNRSTKIRFRREKNRQKNWMPCERAFFLRRVSCNNFEQCLLFYLTQQRFKFENFSLEDAPSLSCIDRKS